MGRGLYWFSSTKVLVRQTFGGGGAALGARIILLADLNHDVCQRGGCRLLAWQRRTALKIRLRIEITITSSFDSCITKTTYCSLSN